MLSIRVSARVVRSLLISRCSHARYRVGWLVANTSTTSVQRSDNPSHWWARPRMRPRPAGPVRPWEFRSC